MDWIIHWWRRLLREGPREPSRVLVPEGVDKVLLAECPRCHERWALLTRVGTREYDLTPDCPKGPH